MDILVGKAIQDQTIKNNQDAIIPELNKTFHISVKKSKSGCKTERWVEFYKNQVPDQFFADHRDRRNVTCVSPHSRCKRNSILDTKYNKKGEMA